MIQYEILKEGEGTCPFGCVHPDMGHGFEDDDSPVRPFTKAGSGFIPGAVPDRTVTNGFSLLLPKNHNGGLSLNANFNPYRNHNLWSGILEGNLDAGGIFL